MIRARPARIARADVRRGVAFHYATDAAFHRLEAFTGLCGGAAAELRSAGVRRGPARGAAHVAVELALDAALAGDHDAAELYRSALAEEAAARAIEFDEGGDRFADLLARLARRGPPADLDSAETLAGATARALSRRPRLALCAREADILAARAEALVLRVRAQAPQIARDLRAALPAP